MFFNLQFKDFIETTIVAAVDSKHEILIFKEYMR